MKKQIISVVFAVSIAIIISGCGNNDGAGTAATGSVSGYVYAPIGGAARVANAPAGYQPLSGATVTCGGASTTTDGNGYYILTGVPVGANKTLTISKENYGTITQTVTVTQGQTTVAAAENSAAGVITPASSGAISVVSTPASATIYIDSVNTGLVTPQTLNGLTSATHTVSVRLDNYIQAATQTITVATGQTTSVSFTLQPFECFSDADCADDNALTLDSCSSPGTAESSCLNAAIACNERADCDDGDPYTDEVCINGGTASAACSNPACTPWCFSNMQCEDGNFSTMDVCLFPNTCSSYCVHTAM